MTAAVDLTVCVLLYGDYVELARRCLGSIRQAWPELPASRLRVGLNAVGDATWAYVADLCRTGSLETAGIFDAGADNLHKYPMMRHMFYMGPSPVTTRWVMWFDDDSFVTSPRLFRQAPERMLAADHPAVAGSIYTLGWAGKQQEFVRRQPWYTGVALPARTTFATGGWWIADMDFLRKHDYPWPLLDHRGGDVMLGAMCLQQSRSVAACRSGVAINADGAGRESRSPRRGFDQLPLGVE